MEERIIELEIRYTEQQDELSKLSAVVWDQAKTIGRLERELGEIRRLLAGASEPPEE